MYLPFSSQRVALSVFASILCLVLWSCGKDCGDQRADHARVCQAFAAAPSEATESRLLALEEQIFAEGCTPSACSKCEGYTNWAINSCLAIQAAPADSITIDRYRQVLDKLRRNGCSLGAVPACE
jgi:hypothetical protein